MREVFEQLAERGERRGPDVVRDAAVRRATRRRQNRRVVIAGVAATTILIVTAPLWWPSHHASSTGVVTTPPDVGAAPVRSVDIDVPIATTDGWRPVLAVPYGDGVEQLGVDRVFGPESAALSGDSLIVLDTNKGRLATYLDDGTFAGATPLPGMAQGAQFVTPIDGGVVIRGSGGGYVLPAGSSVWTQTVAVGPFSDGTRAYCCDGVTAVRMVNGLPIVEQPKGYRTNDGRRFFVHRDGAVIDVQFLDPQPHTTRLTLHIDGVTTGQLISEFAIDGFGNVDFVLYGDDAQQRTRSALVTIAPDGTVLTVTAAPSPFGATNSGTPQFLSAGSGFASVIVESATGLEVWRPSPQTDVAAVPRAVDLATSTGCEHIHEHALPTDGVEGSPVALVDCRIGEAQISVAVYRDPAAVLEAAGELTHNCGTRVIGDDWIVLTNLPATSALIAQRLGGSVPPVRNC
jgi:hypothetical protein